MDLASFARHRRSNSSAQASGLGWTAAPARPERLRQRVPIMPQSLSRVLVHLIFSTKHRVPALSTAVRPELHAYLVGILKAMDCPALQVGGAGDHVHLFFGMSRTRSTAQAVETLKTSSSKWIKTKGSFADFHWQAGYGAFSVSQSDAESVVAYIRDQETHHQKLTFQEEYRRFLACYQVAYDERYVWD